MDQKQFMPLPAGRRLNFAASQGEPWTEYVLENGVIIRAKPLLISVSDVGKFLPNGLPHYELSFQNVLDVEYTEDIIEAARARSNGRGDPS